MASRGCRPSQGRRVQGGNEGGHLLLDATLVVGWAGMRLEGVSKVSHHVRRDQHREAGNRQQGGVNEHSSEFVTKALLTKRIGFGDLRRLQRDILPDGITTRDEAEACAIIE